MQPATPPASPGRRFGDEARGAPRIKTGYEALLNSALKGKRDAGQGGGDFKGRRIGRAVVVMADKAGAKFEEPKAPRRGVRGRGKLYAGLRPTSRLGLRR